MNGSTRHPVARAFERISLTATRWAGSSWAFGVAVLALVVWGATGPLAHFSDTWQLIINTATTIVTFLMVFLIQHAQNKDAMAIQLKLDGLVFALGKADNALIDVEELSDEDLERLHQQFHDLAEKLRRHRDMRVRSAARR